MSELRRDLPPLPERFQRLQLDARGYPIPFFIAVIDGIPDFRVADSHKLVICVKEKRCWLCGQPLGRYYAWCIGPMCAINRLSAEPPQHLECADFAARACPFLTRPRARRREAVLPDGHTEPAGMMLRRNPGCVLVWVSRNFKIERHGAGVLFRVGEPLKTSWYCEGRIATAAEVASSVYSGLPLLLNMARQQDKEERTGQACEYALFAQVARASALFPAGA